MHILVRSADLLQSSAIYLVIILMIRIVSIIYVLRSTQKALRATLFHGCFLVIFERETYDHSVTIISTIILKKLVNSSKIQLTIILERDHFTVKGL